MLPTPVKSSIRLFLLIENRLLRDALSRLFRKKSDFEVVGQAGKESIGAHSIVESQCDVVLCDFFDTKWFPFTLLRQEPQTVKVILAGMEDDDRQFLKAVKTGVTGYLTKDASTCDVIATIRATFRGEAVCSPKLSSTLFQWVAQSTRWERSWEVYHCPDLTIRQRQLIDLVAKGLTNKEIANHLNLSEFTVRNHIHRILKLVRVRTRKEAAEIIQMSEKF